MDINYELYKVFYYVALSLSFSEASKHLFISQSAVSQSIKTLERKLDQKLFIRSTKRVQLTPEGEILLRHIEPAMNLIQRGEAQLTDAATTGGQIRIGASDTICRYFLVPYLESFHKAISPCPHQSPEPDFHQMCGTSGNRSGGSDRGQLSQLLFKQRLFDQENPYFPGYFHCKPGVLRTERPKAFLQRAFPVSHPDAGRKSTTSEFLHRLFLQHQLDLVPEVELSSNDLLIDLARIGLGIAFIPDYCLKEVSSICLK